MAVSCKRKDVLRLTLKDYQKWAEPATQGYESAAKLLHENYLFVSEDLPDTATKIPVSSLSIVVRLAYHAAASASSVTL